MEKRIELEKRARKENQITELNLDNCRSTSIVGLTDEYTALESLSLINVGLTTLKGFPKLPNLKKLELSDNRISSGLNYLTTSPKLQYLNLSGNKIKDLEALKPLEEFKNLAVLDLFNNEATQIENYRDKIFEMLPTLKFLDGFDSDDVEAPSDGEDEDEPNGIYDEDDVSTTMGEENENEEVVSDDSDSDEEDESDEDNGDVSLEEVYNDDLEEDNSEWDEIDGGEDDDEDEDSDEDDADGGDANKSIVSNKAADKADVAAADGKEAAAAAAAAVADGDEPSSRGKKRKHDG